jgi:hypothetical protein
MTEEASSNSFFMTNMSPQVPTLNRQTWKTLESVVKDWAVDYGEINVITGPVGAAWDKSQRQADPWTWQPPWSKEKSAASAATCTETEHPSESCVLFPRLPALPLRPGAGRPEDSLGGALMDDNREYIVDHPTQS